MTRKNLRYVLVLALLVGTCVALYSYSKWLSIQDAKIHVSMDASYPCKEWFAESFEENLEVIANYPRGHADKYLRVVQPHTGQLPFPVIVTAASADFYGVVQGLFKDVHEKLMPKYGNITVIFFDLGLTESQNTTLAKNCKCEVRRFPFERFPAHVRQLQTYAHKPLIIQMAVAEFGWVWYMDSSVRFQNNKLDWALQYSKANSMLIFRLPVSFDCARFTHELTFRFLGEDICKFKYFGQTEPGNSIYHLDNVTRIVVDRWAACALVAECIAPKGAKLSCDFNSEERIGLCHRYDQSIISIIYARLHHDFLYLDRLNPSNFFEIKRGESVNYFQ